MKRTTHYGPCPTCGGSGKRRAPYTTAETDCHVCGGDGRVVTVITEEIKPESEVMPHKEALHAGLNDTPPQPNDSANAAAGALRERLVSRLDGHTAWSRDCRLSGEFLCNQIWAVVADALRDERAQVFEECAKVAEAEKLTGVPPSDWALDKLEAIEAAVKVTARSIAAAIRALKSKS